MAPKVDSLNIVSSTKPLSVVSKPENNSNIEVFENKNTEANIDEVSFSNSNSNVEPEEKNDTKKKWLLGAGIALGTSALVVAGILLKKKIPTIANKCTSLLKTNEISKNYITNLTPEQVRKLETCSIDDFYVEAQKIITSGYKIPEELIAPMKLNPYLPKKIGAIYNFTQNVVYINPRTIEKYSRKNLFSIIAHEYLHQKQNLQVLQTEGIGENAVKFYTEIRNKIDVDSFIKQFGNISKEELIKLKPQLENSYIWAEELQEAIQKGPEAVKAFEKKLLDNDYTIILDNFANFRKKVVDNLGLIPQNSNEATLSQEYLDGFISIYKNKTNLKLNAKSLNEQEAHLATLFTKLEYLAQKYNTK